MGARGGSDYTLYISHTGSSTFTGGHSGHSGHSTLHQPEVTLLPEVSSVFGQECHFGHGHKSIPQGSSRVGATPPLLEPLPATLVNDKAVAMSRTDPMTLLCWVLDSL